MKRYLSMLLVLAMLVTSLPVGAFAEATPSEAAPVSVEEQKEEKAEEPKEEAAVETPETITESTTEGAEKEPEENVNEEAEAGTEEDATEEAEEGPAENVTEETEGETKEDVTEAPEAGTEEDATEGTEEGAEEGVTERTEEGAEEGVTEGTEEGAAEGAEILSPEDMLGAEEAVVLTTENAATLLMTRTISNPDDLANISAKIPSDLEVNTVNSTSVIVEWTPVSSDHDGYEIQSATNASFTSNLMTRNVDGASTNSYSGFTNLVCGEKRYYRIRSYVTYLGADGVVSDDDTKIFSDYSSSVVHMTAPAAPGNPKVEAVTSTSAKVSWDKETEADGYIVYRDGVQIYKSTSNTKLSYTDVGLVPGTEYVYQVYSYKDNAVSEKAEKIEYTAKLGKTTLAAKSADINAIELSWNRVEGANGYYIFRSNNNGQTFSVIYTAGAEDTTYTDSSAIVCGREYRYYIIAYVDDDIVSDPSNTAYATPIPNAPTGLKATFQDSKTILLTWDEVAGASGYIIMSSDTQNGAYSFHGLSSGNSYKDTKGFTNPGDFRYYRVIAYVGTYGANEIQGYESAAVYECTRPDAPGNLTLENKSYSLNRVIWDAVEGADGYEVVCTTTGWSNTVAASSATKHIVVNGTGVTCGNTYTYKVRAFFEQGGVKYYGNYCEPKSIQAKPNAPASLTATWVSGTNKVNLVWDAVDGASGYYITMPSGQVSVSSGKTTYTVTGLTLGETYDFYVCAYRTVNSNNIAGEKVNAECMLDITSITPKNLETTPVSSTSLKVTWGAMDGVEGYEVIVEPLEDNDTFKPIDTTVTSNSYTIAGMTTGYRYSFKVRAYATIDNQKVESQWATLSGVNSVYSQPKAPTNVKIHSLSDITGTALSWTAVEGCDGYEIWKSTSASSSSYTMSAELDGAESVSDIEGMGASAIGTKYYYKVRAFVKTMGEKLYGPWSSVVAVTVLPPRTTLTLKASGATSIKLFWEKVPEADGYVLYRSTDGSSFTAFQTCDKRTWVEFNNTGLTTGKLYYYKVAAYKLTSSGAKLIGASSTERSARPAPVAPSGLTAVNSGVGKVQLTWNKVSGADGYYVYRATGSSASFARIATVKGNSTVKYTDSDRTLSETYKYQVTAYKGSGESEACSPVSVVVAIPQVKSLKAAAANAKSYKLSWDAISGVRGYRIEVATNKSGPYTLLATTTGNSYTVNNQITGQMKYYRVKAYIRDSDGDYVFSNDWSSVLTAFATPLAPTNVGFSKVFSTSLTLKWTPAEGATGYQIYYRKAGSGSFVLYDTVEGSNVSTYYVTGLSRYTKYEFQIRSVCRSISNNLLHGLKSSVVSTTTY